ncbi:protein-serine/threonine phosphatase [Malassezia cuniculi]|uniref:Mitochondrial import inner membrane translocase subunit TIM50 n=1 Tax=Malassezia cuniculi TaxID=948313 RepID=A0AAF0ETE4_9BASI|nr:protein-serine/threonine phosphatase [Malassezia cuniculi]
MAPTVSGATDDAQAANASVSALPTVEELLRKRRAESIASQSESDGEAEPTTKDAEASRPALRMPNRVIQETPKVLVLDLDETLIHSTVRPAARGFLGPPGAAGGGSSFLSLLGLGLRGSGSFVSSRLQLCQIEVVINGRSIIYQVYKRPWADYFLKKVAAWYQVVIFTASVKEYADPVIDWLDGGQGIISGRLFRESCTLRDGAYLKDLSHVDADLSRVCLVDNSPASYALNQANGIPIDATCAIY